ncbi:MAG: ribonuclease Z [Lachnospiraceae bacterium]|nr:MAG: ribonuclease Z [Lachnospiraceae bacterium]
MLDICLLGCGGMMPLPKRHLTSLAVRFNGHTTLIDCGEGTQVAMRRAGLSPAPIDTICVTHYHADHISGLPGLLLDIGNAGRTKPVAMIGPKGLKRVVSSLCVIAPQLPFEITFHELKENEETFDLEGLRLKAFHVNHNVTCYGYTFELDRAGRFDAAAAKALGIPVNYWSVLQHGDEVDIPEGHFLPEQVMGPARKGLKVTYTTDTRPTRSIVENASGSDLFICEGMYGDTEKQESAKEKKHMMMQEAASLGKEAGVKKMWLTHFSPSVINPKIYIEDIKKIFPELSMGKDGKKTELDFADE